MSEEHTFVRLASGMVTCDCGTIHASHDDRDVHIHIEWALRERVAVLTEERDAAREAAELLLDVIDDPVIATEPLRTIRVYSDRVKRARALLGKGQPGE